MKGSIIVIDLTIQTIETYQTICDLSQTIVKYLTMLNIAADLTIYLSTYLRYGYICNNTIDMGLNFCPWKC